MRSSRSKQSLEYIFSINFHKSQVQQKNFKIKLALKVLSDNIMPKRLRIFFCLLSRFKNKSKASILVFCRMVYNILCFYLAINVKHSCFITDIENISKPSKNFFDISNCILIKKKMDS